MKSKLNRASSYALIAMLVLSVLFAAAPANAVIWTTVEAINPIDGTHDFNFTSAQISVGETFVIDITVVNVTDLFSWQFKISWNASLLECAGVTLPPDHVFAGKTYLEVPGDILPDSVVWGCALGTKHAPGGAEPWSFNGTGKLAQVHLRIIQEVSILGPLQVECPLQFSIPDTFVLNSAGATIPSTKIDGYYRYKWVIPEKKPRFYLSPTPMKPEKIGDTVAFNVMVDDVDAGWEIICFQFSIMWNTTFLAPKAPYWAEGTFLEAFEYPADGILYAADINVHYRPPPLTPIPGDYNYSTIGMVLMPDPATNYTYHPPFPHTSSAGKLATIYFEAISETIAPEEAWTWVSFIGEDILVLNKYGMDIGYERTDPGAYRAPVKTLGLSIDLKTQYEYPYGGQGANQPSDMFGPQQQVELFAVVLYNEYPVQQKLVGFEIRHGPYIFWREDTTDEYGIAHVSFRLPWPCVDPKDEIFGKWNVIATVEVAEQKKNDTLWFWVWWPVEVILVEPKGTQPIQFTQRKTGGDPMQFRLEFITYSMQEIPVTITVTVYDELGFFIGSDHWTGAVGPDEYSYWEPCEAPPFIWYPMQFEIPMPTHAVVGIGRVFGNAYDKFPWLGGVPYCPEVHNTIDFYIVKPT